jgi:hypothetical protein
MLVTRLSALRVCKRHITKTSPLKNSSCPAAAKARAAAAAAAAVAGATPAQRERAIQQAVLSMQLEREQPGQPKGSDPKDPAEPPVPKANSAAPAGYEPPEWGGAPEG